MKLITAVIKPYVFDEVRHALDEAGIRRMTTSEVVGYGREGGHSETYRGVEYQVDSSPKLRVEIVVPASEVEAAVQAVLASAGSQEHGDGKIWVTSVQEFFDIRTGDSGTAAL